MSDPYLEKLLDIQSELDGMDIRITALEQGYALDAESVDAYVMEHRSSRIAKYEDFLSKERLDEIRNEYDAALKKGVECDAWDYGLSALIGAFCGVIDAFFCSTPHEGIIAEGVDNLFGESVMKFAKFTGWEPRVGKEKSLSSAIGYLERIFKVGYDQATSSAVNGAVKNMSMSNHHMKSAGHYPDVLGLFFAICDQFAGTSTFYDKNKGTIRIVDATRHDSEWAKLFFKNSSFSIKLEGTSFVSKIIAGTLNWFGHCMSDISGSSGSKGQGTGLPVPFTEFFQFCNFGSFYYDEKHHETFATVMTKVYENGYDTRHAAVTSIPVILNDILVRMLFVIKRHFAEKQDWGKSIPLTNNPELHRMLTTGIGSMCVIDLGHAGATSCGNWVIFFSKMNIAAWARFGQLGLQELQLAANKETRNIIKMQDEIGENWNNLLEQSRQLLTTDD